MKLVKERNPHQHNSWKDQALDRAEWIIIVRAAIYPCWPDGP